MRGGGSPPTTRGLDVGVFFTFSFRSDGQLAEIVAAVRGARPLPAGVLEQLGGRLPAQTGEPGGQRLAGGLGQVPRCCQALCQPHHQTEVSHVFTGISSFCEQIFLLCMSRKFCCGILGKILSFSVCLKQA